MNGKYEKVVYAAGSLGSEEYRRVIAALHVAVNEQKYNNICFDFSKCTAAYPAGILPILSYVLALKNSNIDFSLTLPEDELVARRFRNSNWAHLIEPRKYEPAKTRGSTPSSVLTFKTDVEQQDCVNKLVDGILSTVSNLRRSDLAAVEWALNEITDNVLNHSQSQIGGMVQLTVHRQRRRAIEFTVCDGGLGVANTLRNAHPAITSDLDALTEAVKEGVTRNSTTNQGNGLFGSFEVCRLSKGRFKLHANFARLELNNDHVSYRPEKIPFSGTLVDATIDLADAGRLDQALKFKGKVHRPSDIVEFKYETDNLQVVNFTMTKEARSFASRVAGKPVKTKLSNLAEMCPNQKIVIDFSGVSVISSSFADEVFGMLFLELRPMRFMTTFGFRNASPTITGLIDRAIALRAQQGALESGQN
ncbi:hypothetical protein LMG18090_00101 [Ralstonia mannitolilytica]|jgi:anti-sigma regulatory factor (Ser/Thr protein kinase)|uniref:STAS-like domain-containing protein n=1 Tax=Ralstonia mannitolilytica TaxID=105219 RepID=UPI0028F675EA|nr:STAS-like domain-containing protein [Ralstonia mannitolilytica]CAJ0773550.1 hypothetical protein LMG18090_00101 [Ralstonia mannitolilytica]